MNGFPVPIEDLLRIPWFSLLRNLSIIIFQYTYYSFVGPIKFWYYDDTVWTIRKMMIIFELIV